VRCAAAAPARLSSMGGGASSLARLRKVLLIRAYNSRPKDQTVSEQFAQFRRINAQGDAVLTREDIKQAVGLTAPWFDDLLQRYTVGSMDEFTLRALSNS